MRYLSKVLNRAEQKELITDAIRRKRTTILGMNDDANIQVLKIKSYIEGEISALEAMFRMLEGDNALLKILAGE